TDPSSRGYDTILGGRFNFRKAMATAVPASLKAGFNFREQSREVWSNPHQYRYVGPDGIFGNADDELGQFLESSDQHDQANRGLRRPPWLSGWGVARHLVDNPELW